MLDTHTHSLTTYTPIEPILADPGNLEVTGLSTFGGARNLSLYKLGVGVCRRMAFYGSTSPRKHSYLSIWPQHTQQPLSTRCSTRRAASQIVKMVYRSEKSASPPLRELSRSPPPEAAANAGPSQRRGKLTFADKRRMEVSIFASPI